MIQIDLLSGDKLCFEPYKGLSIMSLNGSSKKFHVDEGPLRIICDTLSYGNYHSLYNLIDSTGRKILDKGVRAVRYDKQGFYVVEDNNEDELINRYHCIPGDKFEEKRCIVLNNGTILTKQWFDDIMVLPNGYIKVFKDNKENLLSLNGEFYLNSYVDFITVFYGDYVYYINDGVIYKANKIGEHIKIKELNAFPVKGKYILRRLKVENGNVVGYNKPISTFRFPYNSLVHKAYGDNYMPVEKNGTNVIDKHSKLIFDLWYNRVGFSNIPGIYYICQNNLWRIVDIAGNKIADLEFSMVTPYQYGYAIVRNTNNTYCILDISGKIIADGFMSVLQTEKNGIWNVQYYKNGSHKVFFHGQGDSFIFIIQCLLTTTNWLGLFERDNIWYYLDDNQQMVPFCEYNLSISSDK